MTDLDGTLLDDKQKISAKNRRSIEEFQRKGGIFTFATGRVQTSIASFIDQLDIQHPIITHNGAQIYCPKTRSVLYRQALTMTDSLIHTLSELENVEIMYFINEQIYSNKKGTIIQLFEKKENLTVCNQLPPLKNECVTKIIIAHTDHLFLTRVEQQLKDQYPSLCTTFSEPEYLELLPTNASKGNALKYVKEHYIDPSRQFITFGNNINDIPLIREADIGIAVYNAHPALKHVSTLVLDTTNEEDAIANYLEKRYEEMTI